LFRPKRGGLMRLTSDFFVSALMRQVSHSGGFGAILRRGNAEAGAIFLVERGRFGTMDLYGPAPQASYEEGAAAGRRFMLVRSDLDDGGLDSWLSKQIRFDSDLWLVEIEPGTARLDQLVTLLP